MAFNVITATFGSLRTTTTAKIRQWAKGQHLELKGITDLPSVFTAYFANSLSRGDALPQVGGDGEVLVPDIYFESGADVYCFVMVHETADDCRYEWVTHIPVDPAPKPSDIDPTPSQQNVLDQLVGRLNEAVAQTGQDVEDADADARAAAESASEAGQYKADAQGYAENAEQSKTAAEKAKTDAEAAETAIKDMTVSVHTLAAGSEATVTKTEGETTFNLDFGIPQGAPGPKGDAYNLTQADREEIAGIASEQLLERIEQIEQSYDDLGLSVVDGMIHTTYDKQEDEE